MECQTERKTMADQTDNAGTAQPVGAGFKLDKGKVRLDLFPPEALMSISEVLTVALADYPERNWESGMKWGRVFGAMMRHMWAWWMGQDKDPSTGKSHLAHAGCCVVFLICYEIRKIGQDDRNKTWKEDEHGSK